MGGRKRAKYMGNNWLGELSAEGRHSPRVPPLHPKAWADSPLVQHVREKILTSHWVALSPFELCSNAVKWIRRAKEPKEKSIFWPRGKREIRNQDRGWQS